MSGLGACVLALDQGGHASRALVFDPAGRPLATAERAIRTRRRGNVRVEHDADAVLVSLREAAEAAVVALPAGTEIACAALATQRSSITCWDRRSGRALSPVISWQDRRAARRVAALSSQARHVRAMTGLMLSPHYGASKIAWCLRELPAVKRAQRQGRLAAGPLASFLLAGLLAERPCVADPVNGSRTQLMQLHTGDWSEELCAMFGVPSDVLPACVPNRYAFGTLRVAGREIPLQVVTGDQPAALFAQGVPEPGIAYMNIGTGAFVQCLSERSAPGLLRSVLWSDGSHTLHALEGTVNGAAGAIETVARKLGIPPGAAMRGLPAWLADSSEVPLYLNGIGGLGAPYWRPEFRSRFIGRGDPARKMAAVVESIAFLLLANLKRMRGSAGTFSRLRLTGGLAQLDGLCQRLADLAGLPVERPELHEATALGLARLAGGIAPPGPVPCMRFEPRGNTALQARHRRWHRAMLEALAAP
jgi:glycerol kinase